MIRTQLRKLCLLALASFGSSAWAVNVPKKVAKTKVAAEQAPGTIVRSGALLGAATWPEPNQTAVVKPKRSQVFMWDKKTASGKEQLAIFTNKGNHKTQRGDYGLLEHKVGTGFELTRLKATLDEGQKVIYRKVTLSDGSTRATYRLNGRLQPLPGDFAATIDGTRMQLERLATESANPERFLEQYTKFSRTNKPGI